MGNQQLLRDDGAVLTFSSLTGAVLTLKPDSTYYNGNNLSDFEETIVMVDPSEYNDGDNTILVYRETETYHPSVVTKDSTEQTIDVSPVILPSNTSYIMMTNFVDVHNTFGMNDAILYSLSYNSSEDGLEFNTGEALGANTTIAVLSSNKITYVSSSGTSTCTWGPTVEIRYGTSTNHIYIAGEMLTGSIDQLLQHFDYNNGGTFTITKTKFIDT